MNKTLLKGQVNIMEKKSNGLLKFFAFIGVLAVIAGIAYALYKYFTPDYLEDDDDDDDFDDDFDDFFEDEEIAAHDEEDEAEEEPEEEEQASEEE